MNIEIYLHQPSLLSKVAHRLSDLLSTGKVSINVEPAVDLPKSLQRNGQTKIRFCNYSVQRLEDNTLVCKENGQKIPLTPQGVPDLEQLAYEISLRKW